ncbi:PEPxxWA-CTERM sorting domain-containing protein [Sphingomonas sp. Leaf231]|uniref:PEPxxWA-CTERM sorting domain-containing protein n=1 Tax=Sphingomonas sp. Leaf231 TaxID=1736301 RepID=UPI000AEB1E6B|nr:PEPxxWA-CTERM sorting domain-containing protein [Sphingomonas sp. Leaf231]
MLKMMGAVAALAVAAPAMAAPATVTVTGTVMSGVDVGGQFGAAGTSLIGQPFSAIFTIDAASGSSMFETATSANLYGTGPASPVSAVLTIGGGSYRFAGSYSGRARVNDTAGRGGTDAVEYFVEDTDFALRPNDNTLLSLGFDTLRDVLAGADFTNVDAAGLTLADNAKGFVKIANRDPVTGTFGAPTYADLAISTIRAQAAAPVPEPATWAMMLSGFALAGVALRRRPRVAARVRFA